MYCTLHPGGCQMPQCKKCSSEFPNAVKIQYKWHNIAKRSYCLVCSPFGSRNRRNLNNYKTDDGVNFKLCTVCDQWLELSRFPAIHNRNVKSSRCKGCFNALKRRTANEIKDRAVEYKGSKCYDCQVSFHRAVYEFHHRDPTQKDFTISDKKSLRAWETVQVELDKCDMLCANCHRLRHVRDSI